MTELIKIREAWVRFDITARTLRYYDPEERYGMGHIVTPEGVGRPRMNLWVPVVKK
jgi:hypothetical protein